MPNQIEMPPMPAECSAAVRPWGFWASIGWTLLAFTVGLLVFAAVGRALAARWDTGGLPLYQLVARGGHPVGSSLLILGYGVVVAMLAIAAKRSGWSVATYLALVRPRGRYVLFGLLCTALPLLLTYAHVMQFDVSQFLRPHGFDRARAANGLLLHFIAVAIAAPVMEEIVFRGFLYRGLSATRIGVAGTIVITSVAWALMHVGQGVAGMIDTAVVGLAWGWLRWYSGSTLATIGWHVANNVVMSLLPIAALYGWFG